MAVSLRIVDAFTDTAFRGNPAAVCILDTDDWPDVQWMQHVGGEMHMPMTAFARRLGEAGGNTWGLRWFNALMAETEFCGHATLATAHVLFSQGAASGVLHFETLAGTLSAHAESDGSVTLDFPAAGVAECAMPDGIVESLAGARPVATYSTGSLRDVLAVFDSEAAVRGLVPDLAVMSDFALRNDIRGVVATAAADTGADYDFVSRFFSPAEGLPEDSVTGSAHTALVPFWAARLGRNRLSALQASPRSGRIETELAGDRVHLTGRAVTVVKGSLLANADGQ